MALYLFHPGNGLALCSGPTSAADFRRIWDTLQEKRTVFVPSWRLSGSCSFGRSCPNGYPARVLQFRPLWQYVVLPALFVASRLDTGVGLATGYASVREKGEA